ncbi:sensor histidine kinase [Amycolatopsis jiangsuensis]|uniref:histidine kinase n=1 Tax=Amycolatopsis jiangsuensis TaxID=1181879 RepID=A0A840J321_9PSEU|nr:histidine kinase [Amycolatopsis jiangsuensis]MBB4687857.1 signal transduction histidine kinase [Amycolatopsis jiangsuensis]
MAGPAGRTPALRSELLPDTMLPPLLAAVAIVVTSFELSGDQILFRPLAITLFVLTAVLALSTFVPWSRIAPGGQIALLAGYGVSAAALLPLALSTLAPAFAFVASASAGAKLASRRAAAVIAGANACAAVLALLIVGWVSPGSGGWPWWLGFTVAFPAYIGMSRQDRAAALVNAERAAVEAQRAAASEAREAALLERNRIARELHDVLGHSLTGIAMQLDLADALATKGRSDEANTAVLRARAIAVDSVTQMREAVHALRDDSRTLSEALKTLAEKESVSFTCTGEARPTTPDVSHALLRATQEALTNAAKHSPGSTRRIELDYPTDAVQLTVTNTAATGVGPPDVGGGTGLGLTAMRERIAVLGGTVRTGPTEDGGWAVEARIPG